ncbi:MAG TPA: toxin-antitoxin system HicB family antitoxin [Cyanobacteria bacterium UBA9971]|nr:toxin-antitoxin system HicB family antitoxin [Cyanobacteria bacterium UBA9971]
MNKKDKDKNYYLNLNWEFEFEKAPEGGFYARVKELPCHSYGISLEEAAKNIKEAFEDYIETSIEENLPINEPFSDENISGKLNIRTKKSIHLKLLKKAKEENVSVSHLINDAITKMYG